MSWPNICPAAILLSENPRWKRSAGLIRDLLLRVTTWMYAGVCRIEVGHWDSVPRAWFGITRAARLKPIGDNNVGMEEPRHYWKRNGRKSITRPDIIHSRVAFTAKVSNTSSAWGRVFIMAFGEGPLSSLCMSSRRERGYRCPRCRNGI